MWFRVASRTGRTPEEAKRTTSSSGLAVWKEFFLREANDRDWMKQYLAQIAFEIYLLRLSWGGAGGEPREYKSFLLEFTYGEAAAPPTAPVPEKPKPEDPARVEERMKLSKAAWGSFLKGATKRKKAAKARGEQPPPPPRNRRK